MGITNGTTANNGGQLRRQKNSVVDAGDRKWKILMLLSAATFLYLVLITHVLDTPSYFPALSAAVPDDRAETIIRPGENDFVPSGNNNNDVDRTEDRNIVGNNITDLEEEVYQYIPRKGIDPKKKAIRKQRREAKKERNSMIDKDNNNVTIDMSKWTYEETAIKPNMSNDIYYKNIPSEYLVTNDTYFLWDKDPVIPEWMKDYLRWHRYKRSTWDLKNWKKERWLIMQCLLDQDKKKCGGTADRLKPIPALLKKVIYILIVSFYYYFSILLNCICLSFTVLYMMSTHSHRRTIINGFF